jgi:hypothetical protein
MLLSFAQFEREVIGERIRDKVAASRRRGMWMGGHPPLGYDVRDRKLVVNREEAKLVRRIYERFLVLGSMTRLVRELNDEGLTTKSRKTRDGAVKKGRPFDKGIIYKLLRNRVYVGDAVHKGTAYPGEHDAIIDRALWDRVEAALAAAPRKRANRSRAQIPALLKGLIFGPGGRAMTPTHTRKKGKLYRYYVSAHALRTGFRDCPVGCVPAAEVEGAVIAQVRRLLTTPEMVAGVWDALHRQVADRRVTEAEVLEALQSFDAVWDALFPAEQARIVQLLVEKVSVAPDALESGSASTGSAAWSRSCERRGPSGTTPRDGRRARRESQLVLRRQDSHRPDPDDVPAPGRTEDDRRARRGRTLGGAAAEAGRHRRPRLRLRRLAQDAGRARRLGQRPRHAPAQGPPRLQRLPLPVPQRRGALLQQAQALPRRRNTIRPARRQLHRLNQAGLNPYLVEARSKGCHVMSL